MSADATDGQTVEFDADRALAAADTAGVQVEATR